MNEMKSRKRLVVIGGGGHAKVVISILQKLGTYDLAGYVDIEDRGPCLGVPWIGGDGILSDPQLRSGLHAAALGIGQVSDSGKRRELAGRLVETGLDLPAIVSPDAVVNEEVEIGGGTVIMDGAVVGPGTRIGRFCIVNTKASVDHDCEIGDFVHICPGATINGGVKIGGDTLVGAGSTVLQYRSIGRGCMIGMGSVIMTDCEDEGRYYNQPARKKR